MFRTLTLYSVWLWPALVISADPPAARDAATLEKEFAEKLSGAALVGTFSIQGRKSAPKEERYEIASVKKLQDHDWLITSRIKYGDKDVNLPVVVQVFWADDTPVITLTDFAVPGFGKFTCRVLVYRDQYAGTWSGGDHGGHLFGRIVKETKAEAKSEGK